MLKELAQYINDLKRPEVVGVGGRDYSTINLTPIKEPNVDTIEMSTLTGLIDFLERDGNPVEHVVHIEDYNHIRVFSDVFGKFKQREYIAQVEHDGERFGFDQMKGHEEFVIGLQSLFIRQADWQNVMKIVTNISAVGELNVEDDGITQTVTHKAGIVRKGESEIKDIVNLKPFRTFYEIDQPESDFILRMKKPSEDKPLSVGLFEADGGMWRSVARDRVKKFLSEKLGESWTIIA